MQTFADFFFKKKETMELNVTKSQTNPNWGMGKKEKKKIPRNF